MRIKRLTEDPGLPARCALQLLRVDIYLVAVDVVYCEAIQAYVECVSVGAKENQLYHATCRIHLHHQKSQKSQIADRAGRFVSL